MAEEISESSVEGAVWFLLFIESVKREKWFKDGVVNQKENRAERCAIVSAYLYWKESESLSRNGQMTIS